ncbi:MAG: hypothetical protein ABR599_11195 [Gemmatimonadota bacterium]
MSARVRPRVPASPRALAAWLGGAAVAALVLAAPAGCARDGEESATLAESRDTGGDPTTGDGAAAAAGDPTRPPVAALELIDENDLRARLSFFASDLLEGRRAGTRGDALAAA